MRPRESLPAPTTPHYAFVVQFAADTRLEDGRMRGRVEHVISRYAAHFESLEEVMAFMIRILQEVNARERTVETTIHEPGTQPGGGKTDAIVSSEPDSRRDLPGF